MTVESEKAQQEWNSLLAWCGPMESNAVSKNWWGTTANVPLAILLAYEGVVSECQMAICHGKWVLSSDIDPDHDAAQNVNSVLSVFMFLYIHWTSRSKLLPAFDSLVFLLKYVKSHSLRLAVIQFSSFLLLLVMNYNCASYAYSGSDILTKASRQLCNLNFYLGKSLEPNSSVICYCYKWTMR